MQADIPLSVEARDGICRTTRLPDGGFHLFKPGPLAHLFYGGDHILSSEVLTDVFRETCGDCLDLRATELVQVVTGKKLGVYFEIMPRNELTPHDVVGACGSEFRAWHFGRTHLFVSPSVARKIQQGSIDGLSFSPGFSRFAGKTFAVT